MYEIVTGGVFADIESLEQTLEGFVYTLYAGSKDLTGQFDIEKGSLKCYSLLRENQDY